MSDKSVYERLAERFPTEDHKRVNKGGGDQTYVPAVAIFDRVDEVLTPAGWQARVIREGLTATEAWVLCEVTATIDGVEIVRQQYGCEAITVGRDAKPVSDLFKKAATDGYKKCLTLMGVARYLYDHDERAEVEADMREAARRPREQPTAKPTPINAAVRDAAILTGAENIKKLQAVMKMAMAEGIEFNDVNPSEMPDDEILSFGKLLADSVRAARAAKQAAS